MPKAGAALAVLAGVCLIDVSLADACGDKYVVIGRGVKYSRTKHTASILIYKGPGSRVAAGAKDAKLEANLKQAGHRVQSVADATALDAALSSRKFDLVLADLAESPALEKQVGSRPSKPLVVPVLYEPTPNELAAAEKEYGCALKAPSKDYLATIDDIVARKLKGSQPKTGKSQ